MKKRGYPPRMTSRFLKDGPADSRHRGAFHAGPELVELPGGFKKLKLQVTNGGRNGFVPPSVPAVYGVSKHRRQRLLLPE
jgi:hypothetical protein